MTDHKQQQASPAADEQIQSGMIALTGQRG
jgi:hypothetical protein